MRRTFLENAYIIGNSRLVKEFLLVLNIFLRNIFCVLILVFIEHVYVAEQLQKFIHKKHLSYELGR